MSASSHSLAQAIAAGTSNFQGSFTTHADGHDAIRDFGDEGKEYDALRRHVAVAPLFGISEIEFSGKDRQSLVHNLCTNEVRRLTPGDSREAFVTNAQAKILFHAWLHAGAEKLWAHTLTWQGPDIVAHFDRYIFREDVQIHDRSAQRVGLYVSGPLASQAVARTLGDAAAALAPCKHVELAPELGSVAARFDWLGEPGWLVALSHEGLAATWGALLADGAVPCGEAAWNRARIEARFPRYGIDFDAQNLPQEVARDAMAISFTKGCYIGQETVARIDALGHVNKSLALARFDVGEVPPVGTAVTLQDKVVGTVTSAAISPRDGKPIALCMLRREAQAPGTPLQSAYGAVVVVSQ